MDVKGFYIKTGADYNDVLRRLVNERIIVKYLKEFPNDKSLEYLEEALSSGDYETAVRYAHTLKGLCVTLGFENITEWATELYEMLRRGICDYEDKLSVVKAGYEQVIEWINEID